MIAGCVLYVLLTGFRIINIPVLAVLITIYLAGEVFEYLFIVLGAKKFGATNKSVIGALIGGAVGALIGVAFFGIGIFLGTLLGIFLGAFLVELAIKKDVKKSIAAGAGGVLGRLGAIASKVLLAFIMFAILAIKIASFY